MSADTTIRESDLGTKIAEWRHKATALDTVAEMLSVEDQHHESCVNADTIRRLRSMAVTYRECAASAESLVLPF